MSSSPISGGGVHRDFNQLADSCPFLRKFVKEVKTSKGSTRYMIDFHDPEAIRSYNRALLLNDYNIDVELPIDHLCPTVQSRVNYIDWIRELLAISSRPGTCRRGIDIGTGASCIYPIIGAKVYGWMFKATEIDGIAVQFARKNVSRNSLDHMIDVVVPQSADALLVELFDVEDGKECGGEYDFCMCNPPFFATVEEKRSRQHLQSQFSATSSEVATDGGELEFVAKIIADSFVLKDKIRWYTSLLGKKSSLSFVKSILDEARGEGIKIVMPHVFKQGKTWRWAVAWSFSDEVIKMRKRNANNCSSPDVVGRAAKVAKLT